MARKPDYTHEQIITFCEDVKDIRFFYAEDFVKNLGPRSKKKEKYSEVVAGWVINHLNLFTQIPSIRRKSPYCTKDHDGENQSDHVIEKIIAKDIFQQGKEEGIPRIGLILDYETPLNDTQSDGFGKIDLIAFDREKKVLRILELKQPNNKRESMLRCVLEAYTYLRLVDKDKLIDDFNRERHVNIPSSTVFVACPLVFRNSVQHKEIQEMQKGLRPNLKKLIEQLAVKPMIIEENETIYSAYEL